MCVRRGTFEVGWLAIEVSLSESAILSIPSIKRIKLRPALFPSRNKLRLPVYRLTEELVQLVEKFMGDFAAV